MSGSAVVGKLGMWDAFFPTLEIWLDQHVEKSLQASVDHSGLPIRLRVVGGGEEQLYTKLSHQGIPKVSHELDIPVEDDGLGQSMEPNNFSKEQINNM